MGHFTDEFKVLEGKNIGPNGQSLKSTSVSKTKGPGAGGGAAVAWLSASELVAGSTAAGDSPL